MTGNIRVQKFELPQKGFEEMVNGKFADLGFA